MEKMLERLGIYDLVAVLLSGICITTFSKVANAVVFNVTSPEWIKNMGMLQYFVLSYFVGVLFQEVSSFIQQRILFRNNKLLKQAMYKPVKSCSQLEPNEIDRIKEVVGNKLKMTEIPNDRKTYDYCRHSLSVGKKLSRTDNDQSISGLSRSLTLYFVLLGFCIAVKLLHGIFCLHAPTVDTNSVIIEFLCFIASWGIACILYYRFKRFAQMRYIYILRAFYNENP